MRTPIQPAAPAAPQPPTVTVPSAVVGDPVAATTVTGQGAATIAGGDAQLYTFTYSQLMARADELSRQITSAHERRSEMMGEMRRAPASVRDGIQDQVNELSGRIVQLERDIAQNGQLRAIAKARETDAGTLVDGTPQVPRIPFDPDDIVPIAVVFTIFVLSPIALAFSRLLWKRASRPTEAPMSRDSDLRLQRVEEGVEAIAVEVERISEGQRFVTQLMAPSAIGQGAAQPVRVPVAEPVPTSWQQR
jgi:hypothetical protein